MIIYDNKYDTMIEIMILYYYRIIYWYGNRISTGTGIESLLVLGAAAERRGRGPSVAFRATHLGEIIV